MKSIEQMKDELRSKLHIAVNSNIEERMVGYNVYLSDMNKAIDKALVDFFQDNKQQIVSDKDIYEQKLSII
jgi:hypothetical protein